MASSNYFFSDTEQAILTTILYSDIFGFPLTKEEIWRFIISNKKIAREDFEKTLRFLYHQKFNSSEFSGVTMQDSYYCLAGREEIIQKRKKNRLEVVKKLRLAKKVVFYLSHIQTITFIGLSGGLALENATREDDIDLFIIVKKGTLYTTRFWILAFLEWQGLRRKRDEKNAANKICVNLLIDESHLLWPFKKRDLYTAREIAQIKPLFARNDIYTRFMKSNSWIKKFLPNSIDEKSIFFENHWKTQYYILRFISFFLSLRPFETLIRNLQKNYMKQHQTTETVTKAFLAFHPRDYRAYALTLLRSKCEKIGLLTNL